MPHDKDKALEPIEFIQMLKAVDDFYGQPFLLMDWQHEILWDVYGTVNDKGLRQYRYAYLEIPKKNGKTSLIAAIALYHLVCDGAGGQIYCCAADRQQAELVYKAACGMREQNPDLEDIIKLTDSKKEMKNLHTGTVMKVLSAEAYTKHGLNPTVVIFDELHAQPSRDLWDVMTFGAGAARKEPIWWVITTAGDDPDRHSIGWEVHELATKIKDGESTDQSWYVKIYNAPEDSDIYDEKVWHKANPSLGKTINIETVRQEALYAKNSEAGERLFRWLRLNQWISVKASGWIPLTVWDSCSGQWNQSDMVGKECYVGVDLSSTTDLTAAAILFPPRDDVEEWRVMFEAWIPEERMRERSRGDKVPYESWVKHKHMNATPGNAVDYDFVEAKLKSIAKQYEVKFMCPDPWNSRMLTQRLAKADIEIVEVEQTIRGTSPGIKELERFFMLNMISHDSNPVARWCFGNVAVAIDGNENKKLMKNKSKGRIDLMSALVNAANIAIRFENEDTKSVYEDRGVVTF